jgi:HTH-type transcriptional regulator/antitoxin HigA
MAQIKNETQYEVILKRIETLMDIVTEDTPATNPSFIELDFLADLAEEYEMEHYPIGQSIYSEEYDSNLVFA